VREFEVLRAMFLKIQAFWNVTLCNWASYCRRFEGKLCLLHQGPPCLTLERKGTAFHRNCSDWTGLGTRKNPEKNRSLRMKSRCFWWN